MYRCWSETNLCNLCQSCIWGRGCYCDEISVKKGEDLKLDVLLINADKVERNSSEGWTEVWTRGHGVNSDRLTVSDETLIINEFTDTDTGTYRVLDYEGETLITVSVTESVLDWKGNLIDTDEDKTDDTEHRTHDSSAVVLQLMSSPAHESSAVVLQFMTLVLWFSSS
ncbi:unnamed protein product [Leuciscus chuanchicus]